MVTAGDFKKGLTVEWENGIWTIVDFQHVKPGKGAAFVRTKIKNIITGAVIERSFNPTDKMPKAIIETKEMQYLYNDGDLYYFMDTETYEQLGLAKEQVEDSIMFMKENTNATVRFYKGAPFSVEAPFFVELEVIHTEPGFKGDTASNTTKPATVETGFTLQVPLFIEIGDKLKIDTRVGEYLSRA
ncbi:MAG: elongation factor P [Clostridia bacterium]|nr:elongation factor P [Clostridia bacterium]MBQ4619452.1 elongation factor P [Clostridia bacterium]MBQ5770908.1 elongation factor P [Clostridia bacterium]MBR3928168.1 elongation factor P [Clostridia bacterium]